MDGYVHRHIMFYRWTFMYTGTACFTYGRLCTQVHHVLQIDGYVHRHSMLYLWTVMYTGTACFTYGRLCTQVQHALQMDGYVHRCTADWQLIGVVHSHNNSDSWMSLCTYTADPTVEWCTWFNSFSSTCTCMSRLSRKSDCLLVYSTHFTVGWQRAHAQDIKEMD